MKLAGSKALYAEGPRFESRSHAIDFIYECSCPVAEFKIPDCSWAYPALMGTWKGEKGWKKDIVD